ncbi:hypothetical protein F5Y19DRAFT_308012 [Xylariaceae sp. FL1651]|nr:hypothetical protein F5Y19DRAFT_308012 [Xylariaceae sp. FL1651]
MAVVQPKATNPFETLFDNMSPKDNAKDDWEDWDVDTDDSPSASHPDGLLIDIFDNTVEDKTNKPSRRLASTRATQHRPAQLPRVKSRARQKAQNAKAGIKLVTDLSQFRQPGTAAQQRSADALNRSKFADAAALLALEGKPSSPSIGSFAWLRRKQGNAQSKQSIMSTAEDHSLDLSPDSRPIVIGISVPSDDASSHQVSPQTAVVETPMDMRAFSHKLGGKILTPQQQRSVWSPDTEASESPFHGVRPASSIYSRVSGLGGFKMASDAPPVPTLPATLRFKQTAGQQDQDDDDNSSPCTLFEEDDSPTATRKPEKLKAATASPGSASSRAHGWWDHVTTPFTPQSNNPFKTQPQQTGSSSSSGLQEWWSGHDEKRGASSRTSRLTIITPATHGEKEANTMDAITAAPVSGPRQETHPEKARILLEENHPSDAPPPYEPSKPHQDTKGAFTQSHIDSQPIPSPGPMTPGFPGTMTSQGGISLADIPLTPSGVRPVPGAVLPDRIVGSYRTGDHFYEAPGRTNKSERQRRRHEKEDIAARKLGGFWRGRGCIPEEGCFGRSGREGRKRRRICLGLLGGLIAAIILIIVLAVVLTRRTMSSTVVSAPGISGAPDSTSAPEPTFWLRLKDFPPMPTGVLTVSGPNNSVAVSDCLTDTPSTAWSCALPKEDHDSAAPYAPNQPEFIFQIQFDNNTHALWKVTDDATKSQPERRDFVTDPGFTPAPAPPSLADMRFLGNTTDNIEADRKEGEPTPFFISLLQSIDETIGPNMLTRRQGNAIGGASGNGTGAFNLSDILPAPDLNPDGTGAPARLFPLPVQQPVRLFNRDLPTEHYGFYTYFDKKIYMANDSAPNPADKDGGVAIANATALVTFAQTRFLVQIWTRLENTTQLLNSTSANATATPSVQPGSMPYPVTVTEDMHGGNPSLKTDFAYGVLDNMQIDRANARVVTANIGFKGTLVNGKANADLSLGGIDGGTGGCKCEWVNFEKI